LQLTLAQRTCFQKSLSPSFVAQCKVTPTNQTSDDANNFKWQIPRATFDRRQQFIAE
jgi:hypothetical protein